MEPQPDPSAKGWKLVKVETFLENGIAVSYETIAKSSENPLQVAERMANEVKHNFTHATITTRPINPVFLKEKQSDQIEIEKKFYEEMKNANKDYHQWREIAEKHRNYLLSSLTESDKLLLSRLDHVIESSTKLESSYWD